MFSDLKTLSGDALSPLCFGAMQFGGRANEAASRAMFDACRAAGLNFFDTAYGYTDGASETLLGQFAAKDRDKLFIATKVASTGGAGAANMRAQLDISRQRLGMDQVDLLYVHRWDAGTPLVETMQTLARMRDEGLMRHVGLSNFAAWQAMKAADLAQGFGLKVAMLQPMYNLVKRQAEVEILPMAASEGFAVVPYSPLGGGLLTGKYARAAARGRLAEDQMYAERYGLSWMHQTGRELNALAGQLGTHAATLAVTWAARHPAVSAPIISARDATQLMPSLAALDFEMDDRLYDRITALSQTPPPATDRLEEA
ncbi:aldo/keto reductase [Aliiroseovarius subalbicans]|uniref:aldo/keto reductase n=1 Tax=Aliiroseovarius subalbicans TaxID=2925840 RepID=UPI001F561A28|nr:aldo/keto reductase [Aliiroseovarius subalbicans]MCI2400576.1 aldo/keto reductase [Aliiroseovarius subalbicans]